MATQPGDTRDPKTNQLIYPGFQRGPGLHNASSYQVSAIPFLTGNLSAPGAKGGVSGIPVCAEIHFPTVTSWVKIDNLDTKHQLRVSFSEFGSGASGSFGGNYMTVQSATGSWNTTGQLGYKVKKVFVRSDHASSPCRFQVSAGLTHIVHDLSASAGLNWSGSAGVG